MSYRKICPICNIEFETIYNKKRFCNKECYKVYRKRNNKLQESKNCVFCGSVFLSKKSTDKYCCDECRILFFKLKNKKKDLSKNCIFCNSLFLPKSNGQKFCSKKCFKDAEKEYRKEYWKNNSDSCKKITSEWRALNKDYYKNYCREYYFKNSEARIKYSVEYRKKNIKKCKIMQSKSQKKWKSKLTDKQIDKWRKYRSEYQKKYIKNKMDKDIGFNLKCKISSQLRKSLKSKKNFTTFDFLKYNQEDLRIRLESLFKEGMSWENYGKYGWHIDHIKPVAAFKLIKENGELDLEQTKLCWSLDNLQPLWAKDNISKGSWYEVDGKMCRFSNGEIVEIREDNS